MLSGWAHTYKSKEYTHLRNSATLKWGLQGYNWYDDTTVIDLQSRGLHRLHSWFMRWWYGNWFRCTVGETVDIQIVDSRVCHDGLYDDLAVVDLHVHEMEHWKSIPDYFSWVWIPIQGHLWRHSEVRESEKRKLILYHALYAWLQESIPDYLHMACPSQCTLENVERKLLALSRIKQDSWTKSSWCMYMHILMGNRHPSWRSVSACWGGSYPLTIRSQSDHSPIYSPITVRSQSDHMFYHHFTLLAWKEFTDLKGDLFFSCEHLKLLVKYMIGLWSDCDLTVDRTVIGL